MPLEDERPCIEPEAQPDPEIIQYIFIQKVLDRMDKARPTREWYQEWERPPNVVYFDERNPFGHKDKLLKY